MRDSIMSNGEFARRLTAARRASVTYTEEVWDDEIDIDAPSYVNRGGHTYKVWTVDELALECHSTLEPSDFGRHYYIVNGAFMFID